MVSFLQKNLSQGNKKLLQDKLKNSLTHNNISVTPHGVLNRIVLKTYITDSQTANTGAVGKRASRECIGKVLLAGSSAGVVIRIGVKELARTRRRTISRRHWGGEGGEAGALTYAESLIREPGSSRVYAQMILRPQRIMLIHS